jgi:hypothetical protein
MEGDGWERGKVSGMHARRGVFAKLTQREKTMTTTKQRTAAKANIKKAASAAKRKKTIAHLPKSVRTALGKEGAKAARKKRNG